MDALTDVLRRFDLIGVEDAVTIVIGSGVKRAAPGIAVGARGLIDHLDQRARRALARATEGGQAQGPSKHGEAQGRSRSVVHDPSWLPAPAILGYPLVTGERRDGAS